jgi:hypothetical protein
MTDEPSATNLCSHWWCPRHVTGSAQRPLHSTTKGTQSACRIPGRTTVPPALDYYGELTHWAMDEAFEKQKVERVRREASAPMVRWGSFPKVGRSLGRAVPDARPLTARRARCRGHRRRSPVGSESGRRAGAGGNSSIRRIILKKWNIFSTQRCSDGPSGLSMALGVECDRKRASAADERRLRSKSYRFARRRFGNYANPTLYV